MTLWTPADLSTAPELWMDASDGSYLYDATSGGSLVVADGAVARWEDRSGNSKHGTQSSSGARPLYKTGIIGGLDVVRFDGSNDELSLVSITQAYPLHVIMVYSPNSLGTGFRGAVNRFTSSSPFPPAIYFGSSGFNSYPSIYWGTSTYVHGSAVTAAALQEWRLGTSDVGFRTNGATSETTAAHSNSAASYWTTVCSGAFQQAAVDIGELLIIGYALSSGDREKLEGYLAHKWGLEGSLPGGHPYKSNPPSTATGGTSKLIDGGLINGGVIGGRLMT